MKKIFLFLAFSLLIGRSSFSQRYLQPVFSNFTLKDGIEYGRAINLRNQEEVLKLDIFEPQGDTARLRPLIIWAHGGSFVAGDRKQMEVVQFARAFAKMGYVTASIDYRKGIDQAAVLMGKGPEELLKAALRGMQDGRAAVRFFKRTVAEQGNPYRIDTTRIMFGGSSAGAFIALHSAYLNREEEIRQHSRFSSELYNQVGGTLEGNSGNAGYSSRFKGVINLCGALGLAKWIEAGEPPVISMHADGDQIVPYKAGAAGQPALGVAVPVEGSFLIHEQAQRVGVKSFLHTWQSRDHAPYALDTNVANFTITYLTPRIYEILFDQPASVDAHKVLSSVSIYPNPVHNEIKVSFPALVTGKWQISNINGAVLQKGEFKDLQELQIQRNFALIPGLYILQLHTEEGIVEKKLIFE
ncbi:MAG: T9SS type A sorting domain-containing protein [Bacteroidia bacterium]|nr:T9SS type A sorting domain-containing protein [Bacteroidia bacterium]MDW8157403.1 T9SS type A sorting domain-containing protein [Bacteroidia bacterium]